MINYISTVDWKIAADPSSNPSPSENFVSFDLGLNPNPSKSILSRYGFQP